MLRRPSSPDYPPKNRQQHQQHSNDNPPGLAGRSDILFRDIISAVRAAWRILRGCRVRNTDKERSVPRRLRHHSTHLRPRLHSLACCKASRRTRPTLSDATRKTVLTIVRAQTDRHDGKHHPRHKIEREALRNRPGAISVAPKSNIGNADDTRSLWAYMSEKSIERRTTGRAFGPKSNECREFRRPLRKSGCDVAWN